MFTTEHYVKVAKVLAVQRERYVTAAGKVKVEMMAESFAIMFAEDNHLFKTDLFLDAVYRNDTRRLS